MNHYIGLLKWTDQGMRNVKDTVKRAEAARAAAEKLGGKLQVYYTMGKYDAVAILELPSDEAANKFILGTGMLGNVRTQTLKAWTQEEMSKLIAQLP